MPTITNEEFDKIIQEVVSEHKTAIFNYFENEDSDELKQNLINIAVMANNQFNGYDSSGAKESKAV